MKVRRFMMRQYEEMISLVDIDIREEDKKVCKRYISIMNGIKIIYFILLIILLFLIFMSFTDNSLLMEKYRQFDSIIMLLLVFIFFLYYSNKKRFGKKTSEILQSQCDPKHMISLYGALTAYAKSEKGWGVHFYNMGCVFYYVGRIEDAKKIVWLMDKYLVTERDLFLRRLLSTHIDYFEKNQEELQRDCEILTSLSRTIKLNKIMKFFLNVALSQFTSLNLEQQGRYDEMYDLYQSSNSYYNSMLVEVMKNYHMYQAARQMEKNELAEVHRQFVLKNGGTLWYKADLENEG